MDAIFMRQAMSMLDFSLLVQLRQLIERDLACRGPVMETRSFPSAIY